MNDIQQRDVVISIIENNQIEIQEEQVLQKRMYQIVQDFFIKLNKKKLLETLKIINFNSQDSNYSNESTIKKTTYFQRFVSEFMKILQENGNIQDEIQKNLTINLTNDQYEKVQSLIKATELRILNLFMDIMRKNSLLKVIKSSRLQQIARAYEIVVLPKNEYFQYRIQIENQQSFYENVDLFYLYKGEIEKTKYYQIRDCEEGERVRISQQRQGYSLRAAIEKVNNRIYEGERRIKTEVDINTTVVDMIDGGSNIKSSNHLNNNNTKNKTTPITPLSLQRNLPLNNRRDLFPAINLSNAKSQNSSQLQLSSLKNSSQCSGIEGSNGNKVKNSLLLYRRRLSLQTKTKKRNTLKILLSTGEFIADEFFNPSCSYQKNQLDQYHFETTTMTRYLVVSDYVVLIKFPGSLINSILNEYNYHEQSQSFYHQKSLIQIKSIHSLRQIDKKYQSLCKKNQQLMLKKDPPQHIQEIKKELLKRYITYDSQSEVDTNSPKQLAKILTKRKKKMKINRKNNFQLPVVQVFSTHSEKKRSHQSVALSPMAIVKTNRNNDLLNKPQNILSKNDKCQIYQIKQWQSSSRLGQNPLSPSMRQLHQITKQKKPRCGGFQLLQLERVLDKIKVNLKKK